MTDYKMTFKDALMVGLMWLAIGTAIYYCPAWLLAIFFSRNLAMGGV